MEINLENLDRRITDLEKFKKVLEEGIKKIANAGKEFLNQKTI